jgi:hypothetical protein
LGGEPAGVVPQLSATTPDRKNRSGGADGLSLIYFHQAERGGYFTTWEEPELLAAEIRAAFKSLR